MGVPVELRYSWISRGRFHRLSLRSVLIHALHTGNKWYLVVLFYLVPVFNTRVLIRQHLESQWVLYSSSVKYPGYHAPFIVFCDLHRPMVSYSYFIERRWQYASLAFLFRGFGEVSMLPRYNIFMIVVDPMHSQQQEYYLGISDCKQARNFLIALNIGVWLRPIHKGNCYCSTTGYVIGSSR